MSPTAPEVPALLALLRETHRVERRAEEARHFFLTRMAGLLEAQAAVWAQTAPGGSPLRPLSTHAAGAALPALLESEALRDVALAEGSKRSTLRTASDGGEAVLCARLPTRGPTVHLLAFMRVTGRSFAAADEGLLHLLAENGWLFGRLLADDAASPQLASLSPRLKQTLELLLAGATEKRIAASLSLSSHTVHDYVKELYRRFAVKSRGELLATLLKRPEALSFPAQ